MLQFNQFPYTPPNISELQVSFKKALEAFSSAEDFAAQETALEEIYSLREEFSSMSDIARIRHTVDTLDPYYKEQNNFFDENLPLYEGLVSDFYKALLNSPFREALKEKLGGQLFNIAEMAIRTFKPEITEDLQKENRLTSEYQQLLASAQIPFEGKDRNLSEMTAFQSDADREIRKKAHEAKWGFMSSNQQELDRIFEELVQTRTQIAQKLGYDNFTQLGYDRMERADYNAEDVARFREHIREYFVPLATRLRKSQAGRIGLDKLMYFDEPLTFPDGNARPKGSPDWIQEQGQKMYDSLSPDTGEWYRYMTQGGLMDLEARKGKAGGGYCTFIPKYQAPYIFANFNGTEGDVFVLTHEAGHAFQVFMSRNQEVSEYQWPTLEACEIHSMSMEYFTWPYMDLFFEEQVDKYRYGHLLSSVLFLPYGVAVDEFQHEIYAHPTMTAEERFSLWRSLERKYLPHRDYGDNEHLERGGFWQIQRHIFQSPFYYIDYVLAQICAFQFWMRSLEEPEQAFADYVKLCKVGGSKAFLQLVSYAGLQSPFELKTIEAVVNHIENYLEKTPVNYAN